MTSFIDAALVNIRDRNDSKLTAKTCGPMPMCTCTFRVGIFTKSSKSNLAKNIDFEPVSFTKRDRKGYAGPRANGLPIFGPGKSRPIYNQ